MRFPALAENVERDREVSVLWVKEQDLVGSLLWNKGQDGFNKITMRVKKSHASVCFKVLKDEVCKQG